MSINNEQDLQEHFHSIPFTIVFVFSLDYMEKVHYNSSISFVF